MSIIMANLNPKLSVKKPYAGGIIAPPTIIVHNIPDPCGLLSPRSSIDIEKIVGNMIELKSPTDNIANIDTVPCVAIDIKIILTASNANVLKTCLLYTSDAADE